MREQRDQARTELDQVRAELDSAQSELEEMRNAFFLERGEKEEARAKLKKAIKRLDLYGECVDDIIFAYNSSSFATELPRAFGAALNGSNCSALGYYFN